MKDDAEFCSKCGTRIDNGKSDVQSTAKKTSKRSETSSKGIIIIIIALAIIGIVIFIVSAVFIEKIIPEKKISAVKNSYFEFMPDVTVGEFLDEHYENEYFEKWHYTSEGYVEFCGRNKKDSCGLVLNLNDVDSNNIVKVGLIMHSEPGMRGQRMLYQDFEEYMLELYNSSGSHSGENISVTTTSVSTITTESKTTSSKTTKSTTTSAKEKTEPSKSKYYSIYCTALNSVDKEIKVAYGNTKPLYYKYYLYDINKDGIYELIVHVGDTEAEASILLYSFNKNGETFELGEINGGHTVLTEKNGELYSNQCHMGYQRVDKIDMVGWHGEWSVTTETVLEKDNLVDYASYGTPLKGYDISDTSPIEALCPKEVLDNKPYVNGYVKTYALSGRDGSKIRLYLNGDFDKVSIQIYNEEYTGEVEYYEADDFDDYIELNFNPLAQPPSVVYVTPYSNSGFSGDMITCDIPEKISETIQTGSISYPAGNIKGQINCHGGTVAGFTTDYVVNGGAVGTVRNSLGNTWHVTAKNVCTNYGIKWYELWDSDDGDYYGWVDSNYIDFY